MTITMEQFMVCCPSCRNAGDTVAAVNKFCDLYEINNPDRLAGFLAQCGHESSDFNALHENLNYSADGLQKVFPRYFPTPELAQTYARQPEKIANRVYADRMGNGPEQSGDGYKYRGRGAIQTTGFDNYHALSVSMGKGVDDTVTYCESIDGAIESACWFWKNHGLNQLADQKDNLAMTRKINGGTTGLDDRQMRLERAFTAFASA
jgi:putative chitinase